MASKLCLHLFMCSLITRNNFVIGNYQKRELDSLDTAISGTKAFMEKCFLCVLVVGPFFFGPLAIFFFGGFK